MITRPEQIAQNVLKEFNINSPAVDVEKIIKAKNISLIINNLPGDISGILDSSDSNNYKIIVNGGHHPNRQRFSMAHELGHYLLHDNQGVHVDTKSFYRDARSQTALYPIEIESNKFAAELLMPGSFIEKELSKYDDLIDTDDDIITELSKKFEVSTMAMAIKIQSLGYQF